MSKQKLTPWFPGHVKPVRPGVYQVDGNFGMGWKNWDGSHWLAFHYTSVYAVAESSISVTQDMPWRGLASDPKKGPK